MSESRLRVLVVEDDLDDEALTLRALRESREAPETVVARSLPEALAALGLVGPPSPSALQLVLCDLAGGGTEALVRRVRMEPRYASLPVVTFATSAWESNAKASLAAGASAHVVKPIGYAEYKRLVAEILDRWTGRPTAVS